MAPPLLPVHFQKQEKPTKPKPGGPSGRRSMLLVDPVRPFAALGFEGLDLVPGLLHRAGHEPLPGFVAGSTTGPPPGGTPPGFTPIPGITTTSITPIPGITPIPSITPLPRQNGRA